MKVIKAMKKLKFWSRKKKKKKACYNIEHPSSLSCHWHHHYQYYHQVVEPSAPPLPAWLEYDQTQDTNLPSSDEITSSFSSSGQAPFATKDNYVPELDQQNSTLPDSNAKNTSYQQYMVPNPVYGVPVAPPQVRRERDAGAFGCVFAFGAHLFRCFFPCFHIKEV